MCRLSRNCSAGLVVIMLLSIAAIAKAEETQGKLKAVYPDKREVIVDDYGGKMWTFKFARDGKVMINNQPARLEDLFVGEYISVEFERPMDMPEAREIRCKRN